jgi:hypothetical protein
MGLPAWLLFANKCLKFVACPVVESFFYKNKWSIFIAAA